jgi:midasin
MACQQISHIQDSLRRWSLEQPQINYLIRPALTWIASQDTSPPPILSPSQSMEDVADSLIDSLLVVVQSMLPNCPEELTASLDDNDQYILQQYQNVRDLTYLLELDAINARVDSLIANLASKSDGLEKTLLRSMPFLEVYLGVVYDQISRHCQWTKTLFKLSYVTGSVIQSLSEKGFCKPPEAGDAKDDADADTGDLAEGVGFGEAVGLQNASKEIEDENQVEGLKGEEGADPRQDGSNEDEEAIEMSQDIGGEMEDVPEESTKDEDSGPEDESEIGPEERLGKLDASDPSAVDEKLWQNETGPENSEQTNDKTNKDGKDAGESEVVAKDGKHREKQNEKEAIEENVPEMNDDGAPTEEEMETQGEDEPNASGAPMDEHIPDANTLDLPDDMNLEDLEMEPTNGEQEEVEDEIPEGASEADAMEDIDHQNDVGDEHLGDEGQACDEMTEQGGQEADGDDSTGKEDPIAQADISAGQGGAESTLSTMGVNQEQQSFGAPESSAPGEPGEQAADILEDKKQRYSHLMI